MPLHDSELLAQLEKIARAGGDRLGCLQRIADVLRTSRHFRWVGLYEVDRAAETVRNLVWSGPAPPEYPVFSITKGLTGSAIAERRTVNIGNVAQDPRYLTALSTTESEIIVPILDPAGDRVIGTLDIESEKPRAFTPEEQAFLESCAAVIRPLWP